jgi:hypothetical protein
MIKFCPKTDVFLKEKYGEDYADRLYKGENPVNLTVAEIHMFVTEADIA